MLISIIIPVYKVEKYLHECLDSILYQSFSDLEILLIDDGSPDYSGIICDEYSRIDKRIKVFHQENKGVGFSRNYGLLKAIGEYVLFVDADDILSTSAIEILYSKIISFPDVDYVKGNHQYLVEGDIINSVYSNCRKYYADKELNNTIFLLKIVKREFYSWNILYRRDFLMKNNLNYPINISLCEDTLFLLKMLIKSSTGVYVDQITYTVRKRDFSASNVLREKQVNDFIKVLNEINVINNTINNTAFNKELICIISTGVTYIISAVAKLPLIQQEEKIKTIFINYKSINICGNISQIVKAILYNISPNLLLLMYRIK